MIGAMELRSQDAHRLDLYGPDCTLAYQCRIICGCFYPAQVDLLDETGSFDPYKRPDILMTYLGTAYQLFSNFSGVVAPDKIHISLTAQAQTLRNLS
jgi:hypothetical protein